MKLAHCESWLLWTSKKKKNHKLLVSFYYAREQQFLLPILCCFFFLWFLSAHRRHHEDGQSEEGELFWREHRHLHWVFQALRAHLLRWDLLHRHDQLSQVSTHTILPLMTFQSFSLFLLLFIDWVFVLDVKMPLAASLLFSSCADVNGCACDFFFFNEGSLCPRQWESTPAPSPCASQRKRENQS